MKLNFKIQVITTPRSFKCSPDYRFPE